MTISVLWSDIMAVYWSPDIVAVTFQFLSSCFHVPFRIIWLTSFRVMYRPCCLSLWLKWSLLVYFSGSVVGFGGDCAVDCACGGIYCICFLDVLLLIFLLMYV